MIKIDWKKDYNNEFICPNCNLGQLSFKKIKDEKAQFKCLECNKLIAASRRFASDYFTRKAAAYGLGCPSATCDARQMIIAYIRAGKKNFQCQVCQARAVESNELTRYILSRYAHKNPIKPFIFEDDEWDLRTINTSIAKSEGSKYIVNFSRIK